MFTTAALVALGTGIVLGVSLRWWLGLLVPLSIPIVYIGVDQGWWGEPWMLGDLWQYAMLGLTALTFAATALGIAIGRFLTHSFSRNGSAQPR
jgi:hypothetical protein